MRPRGKVTVETLRRDRARREQERQDLALSLRRAADVLDGLGGHRTAVRHLRAQAESWERRGDATDWKPR